MGENILRTYGNNRMDQAAEFRLAYLQGRKLMEEQDRWCALGEENTTPFPEDFKYEMLADVIRGKVLVNVGVRLGLGGLAWMLNADGHVGMGRRTRIRSRIMMRL